MGYNLILSVFSLLKLFLRWPSRAPSVWFSCPLDTHTWCFRSSQVYGTVSRSRLACVSLTTLDQPLLRGTRFLLLGSGTEEPRPQLPMFSLLPGWHSFWAPLVNICKYVQIYSGTHLYVCAHMVFTMCQYLPVYFKCFVN